MPIVINGSGTVTGLSVGGLPDGTVDRDTLATAAKGSVLQVVQGTYTSATSNNTAANAWWDTSSLLSASITPSSTSNKILVTSMLNIACGGATQNISTKLQRGGSDVTAALGDTSGSKDRITCQTYIDNTYSMTSIFPEFLDSPSSTSSLTYSFAFRHGSSATRYLYLNRQDDGTDTVQYHRSMSTITLMEIAG